VVITNHYFTKNFPHATLKNLMLTFHSCARTLNATGILSCIGCIHHGLRRAITNTSSCGDSLFVAICYLIATDFNVQSLRLYIVQSFCNAITSNSPNALHCLHQHLPCNVIHNSEIINNWQEYLVKMAMPYHKGKIEGWSFCLQWIAIIYNVNIQVWSSHCNNIVTLYSARLNCHRTIDLLSLAIDTFHVCWHSSRRCVSKK
jgi:hypothetical protein